MKHLFISDAHIGAFTESVNRSIEESLVKLVHYCREHQYQVHILGDLFDYWMEYPGHKPQLGRHILTALSELSRDAAPVTYIFGNHDNWTNGYFTKLGLNTEVDYYDFTCGGTRFFLHHGDGLSDPEFGLPRPLFHRLLRSAWFTKLYQAIYPPEAGLHLMKTFSAMSRENIVFEPGRLNMWSKNLLNNSTFNVVISGHDHIPRVETFKGGTYINLGAFYKHSTVARYTNGTPELVRWSAIDNDLIPLQNPLKYEPAHEQ
jgi:UDP-2,3-diacylglucosamine hydrolase